MTPFDMTTADESAASFDPLPKGKYLAEITDCEERETSEEAKTYPETSMLWFEFTIREDGYDGRKAWMNIVLPEGESEKAKSDLTKALGRLKALLRATGTFSDKQLESKKFNFDPDDAIGANVTLDLRVDKKFDNNKIVKVLSADSATVATEEDEELLP